MQLIVYKVDSIFFRNLILKSNMLPLINIQQIFYHIEVNQNNTKNEKYEYVHINFKYEQIPFTLDWLEKKIETSRYLILSTVLNIVRTE